MGIILEIKFKMSAMLSNVTVFQDMGGDIDKLNLTIPIFTYDDVLEELQYMKDSQLDQLYDTLLEDNLIIKNEMEAIYEIQK